MGKEGRAMSGTSTSPARKSRAGADIARPLDGHRGQYWRGRLPVPQHAHPLVRQFFEILNEQRTTMMDVSKRAGPHWSTIQSWSRRSNPYIDNFEAALNAMGYELVIRPKRDE
jgi:hypothetical protein